MFDTQIYDLIIAIPNLTDCINCLSTNNKIEVLCTHIQNDELSKIPDHDKYVKVSLIKRKQVTTAGAIYGVSKYGAAKYGNGSSSGISIGQIRSPSGKHTKDALIATSASQYADVFVTEDGRLSKKLRGISASCEVWSFEKFKDYILGLSTK